VIPGCPLIPGVIPTEVDALPVVAGGVEAGEEEVAEVVGGDDAGGAGRAHRHRVGPGQRAVGCGEWRGTVG